MTDRIVSDPNVRFGKPCVAGTRITVYEVLELVREGVGQEDINRDYYPDITAEDVRACVQYAMTAVAPDEARQAQPA